MRFVSSAQLFQNTQQFSLYVHTYSRIAENKKTIMSMEARKWAHLYALRRRMVQFVRALERRHAHEPPPFERETIGGDIHSPELELKYSAAVSKAAALALLSSSSSLSSLPSSSSSSVATCSGTTAHNSPYMLGVFYAGDSLTAKCSMKFCNYTGWLMTETEYDELNDSNHENMQALYGFEVASLSRFVHDQWRNQQQRHTEQKTKQTLSVSDPTGRSTMMPSSSASSSAMVLRSSHAKTGGNGEEEEVEIVEEPSGKVEKNHHHHHRTNHSNGNGREHQGGADDDKMGEANENHEDEKNGITIHETWLNEMWVLVGDPVTFGANFNTPGGVKKVGKGGNEFVQKSNCEFHVNESRELRTLQLNGRFAISSNFVTIHKKQHVSIPNGSELFVAYDRLLKQNK